MKQTQDYLAVISAGTGCGSYARGSNKANVIASAARIFYKDWHTMIEGGLDGKDVTVDVLDVTGCDTVSWDSQGFYSDAGRIERPVERIKHTYPEKRRRKSVEQQDCEDREVLRPLLQGARKQMRKHL